MADCVGFDAVARQDAYLLILGTLPGVESLRQRQYYAKKQNSFWKIMGNLVGATPDMPYKERLEQLQHHRIALWDVCAAAEREGSLDSAIQSPQPNDFVDFFIRHSQIHHICFNGQPAAKLFAQLVKPKLLQDPFSYHVLPSTSPAHASMKYEEKLAQWRHVVAPLIRTAADLSLSTDANLV